MAIMRVLALASVLLSSSYFSAGDAFFVAGRTNIASRNTSSVGKAHVVKTKAPFTPPPDVPINNKMDGYGDVDTQRAAGQVVRPRITLPVEVSRVESADRSMLTCLHDAFGEQEMVAPTNPSFSEDEKYYLTSTIGLYGEKLLYFPGDAPPAKEKDMFEDGACAAAPAQTSKCAHTPPSSHPTVEDVRDAFDFTCMNLIRQGLGGTPLTPDTIQSTLGSCKTITAAAEERSSTAELDSYFSSNTSSPFLPGTLQHTVDEQLGVMIYEAFSGRGRIRANEVATAAEKAKAAATVDLSKNRFAHRCSDCSMDGSSKLATPPAGFDQGKAAAQANRFADCFADRSAERSTVGLREKKKRHAADNVKGDIKKRRVAIISARERPSEVGGVREGGEDTEAAERASVSSGTGKRGWTKKLRGPIRRRR